MFKTSSPRPKALSIRVWSWNLLPGNGSNTFSSATRGSWQAVSPLGRITIKALL